MQPTHIANPVSVNAATILDVTELPSANLMLRLSDGRNYEADTSMTVRYCPVIGDYLVTQEDGYEYLNPKDVFEHKYRAIDSMHPVEQIAAAGGGTIAIKPYDLKDNEQYRNQMAGIGTAALGYWKEGDTIHPDFDTLALRDVAKLYAKYGALHKAVRSAMNELGVPQPGTPAPVHNAFDHLHRAFYSEIGCTLGSDDYRPAAVDASGLPG